MNLITYFSKYNYEVVSEEEISIKCPECGKGNKHFNINIVQGIAHCFKCGYKNNYIGLIAKLERLPIDVVKKMFSVSGKVTKQDIEDMIPEMKLPPRSSWTIRARRYLMDRGYDNATITKFDLYYCSNGWFGNRIIIPIYHNGVVVSFQARAISEAQKKYLFPKGSPSGRVLYNFDNMVDGEQIVLVEGPFDVMSLDKQGINAVATFGKKISKDQIKLLEAKHPSKVILMYDSDALGTIQKTFDKLNKRFDTAIAVLPNGDPGDCINPLYYVDNAINNPMDIQLLLLEAEFNHEQMVLCG